LPASSARIDAGACQWVGGRDENGVDFFVVEHFPHVADLLGSLAAGRPDRFGRLRQPLLVDVTDIFHADVLSRGQQVGMVGPHATRPDHRDRDLLIHVSPCRLARHRECNRSSTGCFEEVSSLSRHQIAPSCTDIFVEMQRSPLIPTAAIV